MTRPARENITQIDDYRKMVAAYLRACRKAKGLTLMDVATKFGYDKPFFVSTVEGGNSPLPVERVGKVAQAYRAPKELVGAVMYFCHPVTWEALKKTVDCINMEEALELWKCISTDENYPDAVKIDFDGIKINWEEVEEGIKDWMASELEKYGVFDW